MPDSEDEHAISILYFSLQDRQALKRCESLKKRSRNKMFGRLFEKKSMEDCADEKKAEM